MARRESILDLYAAYETSHDTPDDIVDTFVRLADKLAGPQIISGERRPLRVADVDHEALFENVGAFRFDQQNDELTLCINHVWWNRVDREAQLVLLLHELAHVPLLLGTDGKTVRGHPPQFWDTALRLYNAAKNQSVFVEALFGSELDWTLADWYFVTFADLPNVDSTIECVPERRDQLARALAYTELDVWELFGVRVRVQSETGSEPVSVPVDAIDCAVPPDDQLYQYLHALINEPNGGVRTTFDEYVFDPVTLEADGGSYQVVLGDRRAALLCRAFAGREEPVEIPAFVIDPSTH
jgi:hypothetical protein